MLLVAIFVNMALVQSRLLNVWNIESNIPENIVIVSQKGVSTDLKNILMTMNINSPRTKAQKFTENLENGRGIMSIYFSFFSKPISNLSENVS